eukprot:scaffold538_cov166-Amphora_coffeaeformis.AAC.18
MVFPFITVAKKVLVGPTAHKVMFHPIRYYNNNELVTTTARAVAKGMEKLSFHRGKASAAEHATPPATATVQFRSNQTTPNTTAVAHEAREPATEADWQIRGDEMDFPTHEAMGSAQAKHATAYRTTGMGNKTIQHRVPHKNQNAPGRTPPFWGSSLCRKRGPNKDRYKSGW